MVEVEWMNDETRALEVEKRRGSWLAWESRFWESVDAHMGPGDTGATRLYGDIWVMTDSINDTLIRFAVCPAIAGSEAVIGGFSFTARWTEMDAQEIANDVLALVKRVREDSVFRMQHRDRR
jgi:hypothetical protein